MCSAPAPPPNPPRKRANKNGNIYMHTYKNPLVIKMGESEAGEIVQMLELMYEAPNSISRPISSHLEVGHHWMCYSRRVVKMSESYG